MLFRAHAHEPTARAYEACADELEKALAAEEQQPLTLRQAANLSGYSVDHLGRLVREGKIPNAGRPNAPRVRRADVPNKPGRPQPGTKEDIVRAIIEDRRR